MDLEAFILIGGRSSRLGTDKAFVEIGGETLAARMARIVETGLAPRQITFAAGEEDQFRSDLVFGLGRPVIADLRPGFGAWSALHASLATARAEWILAVACDLPFVSGELLRLLAGLADDNFDAVVGRQSDGRLQPLCAFYRVKPALANVEALFTLKGAMPSITAIFGSLSKRIVGHDEYKHLSNADNVFLNVNTRAELEAAASLNRP
jgi:molybdopterin-guanine dinucleotide biosynthesis protein A